MKRQQFHRLVSLANGDSRIEVDEKEGTASKLPRIEVSRQLREVERGRFYVLSTDIEAYGHVGSCPGYALLQSQREATGFRERIGTTILAGEARKETCKDRVAERERVREMRRARIERGADASGGYTIEDQHEEKKKRDIQVNERESEATSEEQTDEWRKTVRYEQEAPKTSASSDPYVSLAHRVRDETPSRPGSVLVQKSFEHISALNVFYEKDERENRCIGEVWEWYRYAGSSILWVFHE